MKKKSVLCIVLAVMLAVGQPAIKVRSENVKGRVKIKSVNSYYPGRMTVKWKKVKGLTKYQIKYSCNKKFKGYKVIKVRKNKSSKTIKKLRQGQCYYVKIRGINGKRQGKWSATKSVSVMNKDKKTIDFINSKCDFKIPTTTNILSFTTDREEGEVFGKKIFLTRFYVKAEVSEKFHKKIIKKKRNVYDGEYSINDYREKAKWWDLSKNNLEHMTIYINDRYYHYKEAEGKDATIRISGEMRVFFSKKVKGKRYLYIQYCGL